MEFTLVIRLEGKLVVTSQFIYKIKIFVDISIDMYKY
jgi:hypothetical protein